MNFQDIIEDPELWKQIMAGSMSPDSSLQEWSDKRKIIAELISSDGSVLDLGCANGFFLISLQEWSGHKLVPYGIDIQDNLIEQAKYIFPDYSNNFKVLDVKNILKVDLVGLPKSYDYVFWNFLGSWNIQDNQWQKILKTVKSLVRKRLIIGLYGSNQFKAGTWQWQEERNRLMSKLKLFESVGIELSGIKMNPTTHNQAVVWIDK